MGNGGGVHAEIVGGGKSRRKPAGEKCEKEVWAKGSGGWGRNEETVLHRQWDTNQGGGPSETNDSN